jgi:hypothetical protein
MIHNTPSKDVLTLPLYNNRCTTDSLMMSSNVEVDWLSG